jgi:hypothetical protein
MRGWNFTIITIILSSFILKDLLTNFIVTCALKDRRVAWLCLVEGYLASFHDLVSFKIEHTVFSRIIRVTKENAIGGLCLKLIKLALLENKASTTKSPKIAHSRCSPMHELIAHLFQESPKKIRFPTWHAVFTASAQYLLKVLNSSSIVRAISQREQFFLSTTPL